MNIVGTTLWIVDMQTEYVLWEGCESYIIKRSELVSNILLLADSTLSQNGRVVFINTKNHWENIAELEGLKQRKNVVSLTKFSNFYNVPRFNQKQNISIIKNALKWEEFLIVWVNASWCVLETAKSAMMLKESSPRFTAKVSVPFHATMNIPYPETHSDDSQLCSINIIQSVRNDYDKHIGKGILIWKSLFE